MKRLPHIFLTNWVHIVGFYITICLWTIDTYSNNSSWILSLLRILLASLFSLFYGIMFLVVLYIGIALLDLILFPYVKMSVLKVLILQWSLLSLPFVYWGFEYNYWWWLVFSFLMTQLIRKGKIERLLEIDGESKFTENQ